MSDSNIGYSDTVKHSGVIAKNTFLLLVRMFVLTVINLYAIRVLIKALGDDDYGLYNTVAGVVIMLSCVSTVLSISTQRFYSYESGKKNDSRLDEIFSKSLNLNLILSGAVIILLETIGLWYVCTQMQIPVGKMGAVHWVYQFAVFSFVCMLLQIPFMAAVMAHEDMGIYTIITTSECFLKLVVIYLIGTGGIDKMVFYGGGLFVVVLLTFLSYVLVAGKRYQECHYTKQKDRSLYKELLLFSGWTFYGSVAGVALIQGNTLLLNQFFALVVNAAFAVAVQIQAAFLQLCNSVVLAIRPAMIRSYASNDYDGLNFLFSFCNKSLFFILAIIGIPLIIEMPFITDIWLDGTTTTKILFARLMVVYVMVMAMQSPITIIMQASGNIKLYHLLTDSILLTCIPVSWVLFKFGMPAYVILVTMITVCVLAHIARLWCLKRNYSIFSVTDYIFKFAVPFVIFALIAVFASFYIHRTIENPIGRLLLVFTVSFALLFILIYFFGVTAKERGYVKKFISKFLKRKQ